MVPGETDCQITPPGTFFPITMRYGNNETIAIARMLLTDPEDLTIGGSPALFGKFAGEILYVEKAGQTLVIQAALQDGVRDKVIGIANAAIARFP